MACLADRCISADADVLSSYTDAPEGAVRYQPNPMDTERVVHKIRSIAG